MNTSKNTYFVLTYVNELIVYNNNLIEKNQIPTILYNFNILIQYLSFSSILYKYVFNIIMKIKYSY